MITRNTVRYNCPIRAVPTKDDVRVSLDVGLNFHIGRSEETFEEDAKRFFYNFGPNRLGELLHQECDEEIRDYLRNTRVKNTRDIKSELTQMMLQNLQTKFDPYGVKIEKVDIMKVILPKDLREALQHTTNYDVYLQKQVKYQENKLLTINNFENKKLLQLKRDNL